MREVGSRRLVPSRKRTTRMRSGCLEPGSSKHTALHDGSETVCVSLPFEPWAGLAVMRWCGASLGGLLYRDEVPAAHAPLGQRKCLTVCDRRAIFVTSVSPLFDRGVVLRPGAIAAGTHRRVVPQAVPVA